MTAESAILAPSAGRDNWPQPNRSLGIIVFVAGAAIVPGVILATSSGQSLNTTRTYLYFAIAVYAAGRLSMLIAAARPRIASGVFFLFLYVGLGVAPLTQVATGVSNVILDPSKLPAASVMVLLAAAAAEVGRVLANTRRSSALYDVRSSVINPRAVVLLAGLSTLASLYFIHDVGISSLFANREEVSQALAPDTQVISGLSTSGSLAGRAILVAAGTAPVLVAWIAWTRLLFHTQWRKRPPAWVGWVVLTLLNITVNNPISNSRFWALTVFFGFLFALRSAGPRFFQVTMVLGAVAAIVIFPYADYFRQSATTKAEFGQSNQSLEQSLANKDYDQMTMTANALSWIDIRGGHTDGAQLASSALFFIPHSVWPGRATDTGVAIARILPTANQNQNLSSPLWVEFYVDFGWLGVAVGFVMFGWLSQRLDGLYVRVKQARLGADAWIEVALPVLVGYQFIIIRGPLLQAMSPLAALVVCLLVIRKPTYEARRKDLFGRTIPS